MLIIEPALDPTWVGLISLPVGLLGSSRPARSRVLEDIFGFEPFVCGENPVVGIFKPENFN